MPRRLELVAAAALLALAAAQWPTNIPTIDWKTELEWDTAIWKSGVAYQATVAEGARYVVGNNASLPPQVDIERKLLLCGVA